LFGKKTTIDYQLVMIAKQFPPCALLLHLQRKPCQTISTSCAW